MSGPAILLVRSWPVGAFTCEMTIQRPESGVLVNSMVEWSPAKPSRLSADEWREYRRGRNQAIAEFAGELGIGVAVLEI